MTKAYQWAPARCKHSVSLNETKGWKKHSNLLYEEKVDGRRYLLQIRPRGFRRNYLTSRRISVKTKEFVEQQNSVPMLRNHQFPEEWGSCIFDGEWCYGTDSNSAAHGLSIGKGKYVVWDLLMYKGVDFRGRSLKMRRAFLHSISGKFPKWIRLAYCDTDPKELRKYIDENDLEGMVQKTLDAPYGEGWTKAKKIATYDCIIYGYKETDSEDWKEKKWIGALLIGQWQLISKKPKKKEIRISQKQGKLFPLPDFVRKIKDNWYRFVPVGRCSGLTNEQREEFSAHRAMYLGEIVEVECNLRFSSGFFRHPRFIRLRKDKNPSECIWEVPKDKN